MRTAKPWTYSPDCVGMVVSSLTVGALARRAAGRDVALADAGAARVLDICRRYPSGSVAEDGSTGTGVGRTAGPPRRARLAVKPAHD